MAGTNTIGELLAVVKEMRNAQQQYFALIKIAKISRRPENYADAANALKRSKYLEEMVDQDLGFWINSFGDR